MKPIKHQKTSPITQLLLGALVITPTALYAADATVLPTVEVKGESTQILSAKEKAQKAEKSYTKRTTNIGKVTEAVRDIPQSTTTVTKGLINDQGSDTLKDALRNVAGLTFNAGEGGRTGDNITLRGFSAATDLYLDGMRDVGQYNRDLFNVERVDILRGPASMLFGRGSTGGVVNQESKLPGINDKTELAATVGTQSYKRGMVDFNKSIGETSAVRLNVMATDTDLDQDGASITKYAFAPSIRFGINTDTDISLSYFYLTEDSVPTYGVPYYQGKPIDVPLSTFYGFANADYEKTDTHIITAKAKHIFENGWALNGTLRYGDYARDVAPTAPRLNLSSTGGVLTDATVVNRSRPERNGTEKIAAFDVNMSGEFETGSIQHNILAGVDFAREDSKANRFAYTGVPPTTVGSPSPDDAFISATRTHTSATDFVSNTMGVYAQNLIEFTPQLKLLTGLRWDYFSGDYNTANPSATANCGGITLAIGQACQTERTDRIWSYRTGLVYQPTLKQSYYVSYGTSFNPSGEAYALDPRGSNTPPEKNRNIEAGAKFDLLDGDLSIRTAIFRTEKTNERNTDPLVADAYLLSGKRHTDGVELELAGRITSKWQAFVGLSYMDSNIDEAAGTSANNKDKYAPNTPHYTASLWSTYQITEQIKAGLGFESKAKRFTNGQTNTLPSYTRWDAMVEWNYKQISLQINADNLLNEKYYEGLYNGHVVPGAGRSLRLTGKWRF